MREIKFRAWDNAFKTFVPQDCFAVNNDGNALCVKAWEDALEGEVWYPTSGHTVDQYTGLKDKNGVEIYEGDILCEDWLPGRDSSDFPHDGKMYDVVYWGDHSWKLGNDEWFSEQGDWFETKAYVCGNIHENPELL